MAFLGRVGQNEDPAKKKRSGKDLVFPSLSRVRAPSGTYGRHQ